MKLYSYFRSSCSYRLRIALNLKGLEYDYVAVNLLQGEQRSADYLALNPLGLVPALEVAPGEVLGQSIAVLEWLEEQYPQPPLLPKQPLRRARVRAAVQTIASEMQPLCNIGITRYLREEFEADEDALLDWQRRWMHRGFAALEPTLAANGNRFCFGDAPGMTDLCLVPQVYNARRFDIPLQDFPNVLRIVDNCNALPAFAAAAPDQQPDCPVSA